MNGPSAHLDRLVARRVDQLAPGRGPLIAGVSGGVDSVVLLHALTESGRDVVAAHVNYGLRGEASDEDEQSVRATCDRLEVPCRVLRADEAPTSSIQAWARRVRYEWFERLAQELSAGAIAVAHHADDQAETVLINIIRGTGLDGLSGMPRSRPITRGSSVLLVRPMLDLDRSRIEAYARSRGLEWREDASNESEKYLRSRVRSFLDGSSDLADPERLAAIAGRAESTRESLGRAFTGLGCPNPRSVRDGPLDLSEDVIAAVPTSVAGWLVNCILSEMGGDGPRNREVVSEVLDLLSSQPGRRIEFGTATIWRLRDGLRFEASTRKDAGEALDLPFRVGESVTLPGGRLVSERCTPPAPGNIDLPPEEAILDGDLLADVLHVRPWRPGDRMQPLGMQGTRKVKDILTDRQVPPPEKAGVHVVCSGNDIVWIVGADTDHRFRIKPGTKAAARFNFLVS